MLRNPKLDRLEKEFSKQSINHKHIQLLLHPRLLHDGVPRNSSCHLSPYYFLLSFPPVISSASFPLPPPPSWGLERVNYPRCGLCPPVVGTSIPQRTLRSCSTTRHPWWMATRSSSAWRKPGASCPSSSSPSSTISTGEHMATGVGDNWITSKEITLIWLQQPEKKQTMKLNWSYFLKKGIRPVFEGKQ